MERVVLHIDFDYFYAQCEEIRAPELRTKPACVCVYSDRGEDSGAIATANYAARRYGVRSGMPIASAKKRLDGAGAAFLPVDFGHYDEVSEKAMKVMESHADVFEYVGRDEAYLDVTERTAGDYKRASHLAQQIKNAIREETSLSCSVGISPNKLVSKIASDIQKPDGMTVVAPERVEEFLDPLDIRAIPGIGKKTEERLAEMGLETITDLRGLDVFALHKEFGRKNGTYIYNAAMGVDREPVKKRDARIQYSKVTTLKKDSKDYDFLSESMSGLCRGVHETVVKNGRMFKSVGIHFVQSNLSNRSKSRVLRNPTSSLEKLEECADQLLREALEDQPITIRRLGVRVADLSDVAGQGDITSYF